MLTSTKLNETDELMFLFFLTIRNTKLSALNRKIQNYRYTSVCTMQMNLNLVGTKKKKTKKQVKTNKSRNLKYAMNKFMLPYAMLHVGVHCWYVIYGCRGLLEKIREMHENGKINQKETIILSLSFYLSLLSLESSQLLQLKFLCLFNVNFLMNLFNR